MPDTKIAIVTVTVKQEIPESRIMDLITAGMSGAHYWLEFGNVSLGQYLYLADFAIGSKLNPDDCCQSPYAVMAMTEGVLIACYDCLDRAVDLGWTLSRPNVLKGLDFLANSKDKKGKSFPRRHFNAFMRDNEDAETGDVFLQLCILGELVYG